jgi:hypothetical protein
MLGRSCLGRLLRSCPATGLTVQPVPVNALRPHCSSLCSTRAGLRPSRKPIPQPLQQPEQWRWSRARDRTIPAVSGTQLRGRTQLADNGPHSLRKKRGMRGGPPPRTRALVSLHNKPSSPFVAPVPRQSQTRGRLCRLHKRRLFPGAVGAAGLQTSPNAGLDRWGRYPTKFPFLSP